MRLAEAFFFEEPGLLRIFSFTLIAFAPVNMV
jgi:hypothetical protein